MRLLFFTIFFLCLSFNHYSQTSIGIKTGVNLSKAVYLNEYSEELIQPVRRLKPGFVGGFLIHQRLNEVLSVQAELLYSQKGLKMIQSPYNKSVNKMNYIEIPLSGHYSLMRTRYSSFELYIGGFVSYWTDGKYIITDFQTGEIIKNEKIDFHNMDYKYSRTDMGILAGAVYHINSTDLYFRYIHSMTGSSQENTDALTNRIISFGINYLIIK